MFKFLSDSVSQLSGESPKSNAFSTTQHFPAPNLIARLVSVTRDPEEDFHTYEIEVSFGLRKWTVSRRYKEFHEFNKLIQSVYMVQSNPLPELPPKKMCGNKEQPFVHSRKKQLSQYLTQVMSNTDLRSAVFTREFLTAATRDRMTRLYNEYVPLLKAGATFKKIGSVFTRDIRMRLTDDCMCLEYWTPISGNYGKGEDVKRLRTHTITNVSPTNEGLIITAERECELDTSQNGKSKFVRTAWLNGLSELMGLLHLIRSDDTTINRQKQHAASALKAHAAATLRDTTNNRQKQQRAMKRKSIADKYNKR